MYKRNKQNTNSRGGYWLYGKHPVLYALRNPRRENLELVVTDAARQFLSGHGVRTEQLKLNTQIVTSEAIQMLVPHGAVHQGIALRTKPLTPLHLLDVLKEQQLSTTVKPGATILVCDQITDPHNFGAILRSAAAFGATAVVVTTRNQAQESAVVAKASAGMLEIVPIAEVVNLADALRTLKEYGYWVIGLDASAESDLRAMRQFERAALVLGAEGEGMRQLTAKNCDILVQIEMAPGVESLNVSNSAAIALYERCRKDPG